MDIKVALKKYWPLLVILILGGSLRLVGLLKLPISLFSDEVDMGYQAYSLLKTGCDYSGICFPIQFHSFSDVQPPIPIYLIALASFLGINLDLAIRLVPAVFGTLGILMTYLFVENLKSRKIFDLDLPYLGYISAFLVAIVPWHLTYSRIGFSLALLYFFVVSGLYLFTEYLIKEKNFYLLTSFIVLGLTPMVYNTAKMAIIFYPILLLFFPNSFKHLIQNSYAKLFSIFLFIPVILMFINGGTASRFNYISIFTDPVAGSEVNYQRVQDLGPNLVVGATTSIYSKIFHNKPVFYFKKLLDNFFGLISTDFLFTNGDPNLRHSVQNWGMIYRNFLPLLFFGIYYLIRNKKDKFLFLLIIFSVVSISTSAITREGFAHASRSFMFLLPLILTSSVGFSYIFKNYRLIFYIFLFSLIIESLFFGHDYIFHYRYDSEKSWSSGMKELALKAGTYSGQPVVISPKNEYPLIFYAYYNKFDPKKFQSFVKSGTAFSNTDGKNDLDGIRFGDTNLYIASLIDYRNKRPDQLENAVYYLTMLEYLNTEFKSVAKNSDIIKLHSGEPLFYEFKY